MLAGYFGQTVAVDSHDTHGFQCALDFRIELFQIEPVRGLGCRDQTERRVRVWNAVRCTRSGSIIRDGRMVMIDRRVELLVFDVGEFILHFCFFDLILADIIA